MPELEEKIAAALARKNYAPMTAKELAKRLGVTKPQASDFRRALRNLVRQGRIEFGRNHTLRQAQPHGTVVGVYRRTQSGLGFVRPHAVDGHSGPEILVREGDALDAATGDEVLVRLLRKPARG